MKAGSGATGSTTLNLDIRGGNTLTAPAEKPAVFVPSEPGGVFNANLTITGSGTLNATGNGVCPAIGGDEESGCGNITLSHTGVVNLTAGAGGPAVGDTGTDPDNLTGRFTVESGTTTLSTRLASGYSDVNTLTCNVLGGSVRLSLAAPTNLKGPDDGNAGYCFDVKPVALSGLPGGFDLTQVYLLSIGATGYDNWFRDSVPVPERDEPGYCVNGVTPVAEGATLYFMFPADSLSENTVVTMLYGSATYTGTLHGDGRDGYTLEMREKPAPVTDPVIDIAAQQHTVLSADSEGKPLFR